MPTGLVVLMTILPTLAGALEGSPFSGGLYRSPELGALEFKSEGGRVSGKYQGGGSCPDFQPDQQILEGQFEGNVLVGQLMLCQSGPACAQRSYPLLAFFNPLDGTLSGQVKLDAGCASAGLKGSRVVLSPSGEAAPAKPLASAADIARHKSNAKRNLELHKAALLAGKRAIDSGDYAAAASHFEAAISYSENNWTAYLGLGVSEFKAGNVLRAIEAYQRARDIARDVKQEDADIYYNLACAHSRRGDRKEALHNLRQAVKLGFSLPEQMSADADLNKLFKDDPEFKKLVSQAWTQKDKRGRRGGRGP